eukprot:COSAG02_NODE_1412_length_12756_cov_57.891048_5_plen_41_part_00
MGLPPFGGFGDYTVVLNTGSALTNETTVDGRANEGVYIVC